MRLYLTSLLIIFYCNFSWTQIDKKIDSIYAKTIKPIKVNDKKIALVKNFVATSNNTSESKRIIQLLVEDAVISNDDDFLGNSYLIMGGNYNRRHIEDSAIHCFNKALKIAKDNASYKIEFDSYSGLLRAYSSIGKFEMAQKYIDLIDKKSNLGLDLYSLAGSEINKSYFYLEQERYFEALNSNLKIDSIFQGQDEEIRGIAKLNLGVIYQALSDHKKASSFFEEAKEIYKLLNLTPRINFAKLKLGHSSLYQEEYVKAIRYYEEILPYYKNTNARFYGVITTSLGAANLYTGNYMIAKEYLEESENVLAARNDSLFLIETYGYLSKLYTRQKNKKEALFFGEKANEIAKSIGSNGKRKIRVLSALSEAYYLNEKYKKAYEAVKELQNIEATFDIKENSVSLLEKEHEEEKKKHQLALLISQKEVTEQKATNQRNLFFGGGVILILLIVVLFFLYKNKQQTNKKLKQLEEAKSNFYSNITHEFRTPLTLISVPIQEKLNNPSLSVKEREDFEMIQRNNERLLELVDQLLEISKAESGMQKLQIQQGNILEHVRVLVGLFVYKAAQKDIKFTVDIDQGTSDTWFDRDILEKVMTNLLANAIKYTPEGGQIFCNISVKNGKVNLEIKNTGSGLSKEQTKNIFDRFYQVDEHQEGSGIGLSLVKELVKLHKGNIEVESKPGEWTAFKVALSIDKNDFKTSDIAIGYKIKDDITTPLLSGNDTLHEKELSSFEDSKFPIILVVEDNEDLRTMLSKTFTKEYKVFTAENGEKGVELAQKHIPDLIISDVMMPIKGGIELTRELKSDERTSHIPIILLTAKVGEKHELKGIETGADDYIIKPFNSDILVHKVKNIISGRQKIQERYQKESAIQPNVIAINSTEERFWNKIKETLGTRLRDSSFTAQEFSKEMNMSRMTLHRKLKCLIGLSTTEFINIERLKLAIYYLKTSDLNVSEIAADIGFDTLSYFNKWFKKIYHCTPTEYRKRD